MTKEVLSSRSISEFNLILLPGFVQWDTRRLEEEFSILIRKGPEFASDLPMVFNKIEDINLSNTLPANRLIQTSGEAFYDEIKSKKYEIAKENLGKSIYYINEKKSNILIGRGLPPPIIAEIVNCTGKNDTSIIKKAQHYINSGAAVIDIGCISNKPKPERVREIIQLLHEEFSVLLSIDSMEPSELHAAVDEGIDMILSLDMGNYKEMQNIPKDIPIVILPTNVREGYFPREPKIRVENLGNLTKKLHNLGFKRLIADPLLETPISPGISNSLEAYFLYNRSRVDTKLPLFFGISNVVELMDIDSVGINGLLASIAIELGAGILFTVEHSTKLFGGVKELSECIKLNYIANYKKTPPINQGIRIFKAKGKTKQKIPKIMKKNAIEVEMDKNDYVPDEKGYFKCYVNHYSTKIFLLFYSNEHKLRYTLMGSRAEDISKKVLELKLTENLSHINYLGRELTKAEYCLYTGKPYIQDEKL